MPEWLQIWIVVVTTALVTIALFALRDLRRFVDKVTSDLSQMTRIVRESASRIDRVADETEGLLTSVRNTVSPVQRVVQRLEAIGQRVTDLATSLLDEVEPPLQTASALAQGVRAGTGLFMKRLMNRVTHRQSQNHGGDHHER